MADTKMTIDSLHEIVKTQQATINELNKKINGVSTDSAPSFVGTTIQDLSGKFIEFEKKKYEFLKPNFKIEKTIYTGAEVLEFPEKILSTLIKGTKTTYLQVLLKNNVLKEVVAK